ncbi:MAG: TerB family tellurite resistance protein [Bacteroidota bacterium]|jgi:uncharacterized tellurite resistance protein B-like protein|nr:TerB family tellurite resistance protein [Bacteroidota bacterium]
MFTPILNVMVQLAKIDGKVASTEYEFIKRIAKDNGIQESEVKRLFDDNENKIQIGSMPEDRKFDYIYNLTKLMEIDGTIRIEEYKFCNRIANKLGYRESVLTDLIYHVQANKGQDRDMVRIKEKARKHLI